MSRLQPRIQPTSTTVAVRSQSEHRSVLVVGQRCRSLQRTFFAVVVATLIAPWVGKADIVVTLHDGRQFIADEIRTDADDPTVLVFACVGSQALLERKVSLDRIRTMARATPTSRIGSPEPLDNRIVRIGQRVAVPPAKEHLPIPAAPLVCPDCFESVPIERGHVIGVHADPLSTYAPLWNLPMSISEIPRLERHVVLDILHQAAYGTLVPTRPYLRYRESAWDVFGPPADQAGQVDWAVAARIVRRTRESAASQLVIRLHPVAPGSGRVNAGSLVGELRVDRITYDPELDSYRLADRSVPPLRRAEALPGYRWSRLAASTDEGLTSIVALPPQIERQIDNEGVAFTVSLRLHQPGFRPLTATVPVVR